MSRRTKQLFSLSLLDLLTSALGAVIFLFIITPKGGASASKVRQAMVYFDTTQMKIHGQLPDSLLSKSAGDTMQVVLLAYRDLPVTKQPRPVKKYTYNEARPKPVKKEEPKTSVAKPKPVEQPKPVTKPKEEPKPKPEPKPEPPQKEPTIPKPPVYRGDAPSVPANVSFEVNWDDKNNNVDLFICKGNNCVYGGRKKDRKIGQWDSGKSRNRIFGNDLRTTQEAVRQFDKIIPGEYKIYLQYKSSKKNQPLVNVNGLIYTKDPKTKVERGESFNQKLKLGAPRIHVATVIIKADGSYILKQP